MRANDDGAAHLGRAHDFRLRLRREAGKRETPEPQEELQMSTPIVRAARSQDRAPRTIGLVAAALLASLIMARAADAQRSSGIQLTPDSARYLISKDVGSDRWAITYNLDDKTVTGNVFSTAGSPPQFVWCSTTSVVQAPDPAAAQYNLSCQFAGVCASAPCDPAQWNLGPPVPVTVPGSFLLPPSTASTLAGNVQPIFSTTCANSDACHASNRVPDLLPGRSWAATFEVASIEDPSKVFVAPFDPPASYLLDKVLGIQSSGSRMPLGLTPLDEAQTEAIRSWIREGAANN
jgi:hypothetical protein